MADREFIAGEPDHDYSQADIGELLATVSSSSIVTPTEKWNKRRSCTGGGGLLRTVEKAWGLIGAIRFMEGFYLLVVSRAKLVVSIGFHSIYKVEDVSMIYIPATGTASHPDEAKYSKLFLSVDFTADFYFSYTYQLSRTLQENCLAESDIKWNRKHFGRTMGPEEKFVWNEYLMEPLHRNGVSRKWTLELVRGFVAHQLLELPCAKLELILLARRSSAFAGTRFLKRGVNCDGAVANDVETEQIVWDMDSPLSFRYGKFSSFVQRRGSVPLFWSQDPTHRGSPMVVGKPPIVIDRVEPHALTTAKHFRELERKYGHPLVVLNLTVCYLNDFRKVGKRIDYVSFDVSRCNKSGRVLQRLEEIGQRLTLSTGWFQSFPQLHSRLPSNLLRQRSSTTPPNIDENIGRFVAEPSMDGRMLLQHGIVRSNCVDCLDRTNVVQFGIGKVALGWQLYSMGFLSSPWALSLHSEVCRVFEEMFDEHGDILAWQYAGSQLVHSIKTYKRTAIFQERSRDVLQTISRYYSNTFGDFEKQDGLNLFLGVFR
uniref:SAC domain-containing protein n=1 Tax=Globodera rostochiensis TaxID=31243 RepID=A0A914HH04_GLORO